MLSQIAVYAAFDCNGECTFVLSIFYRLTIIAFCLVMKDHFYDLILKKNYLDFSKMLFVIVRNCTRGNPMGCTNPNSGRVVRA